ncbi:alpha-D-ribose 1-methylphosphonate 5-triphosphate diphosphatase [Geminicoccaceae bacterium 1502E]|nr:alpha-D-ribose 1-methylphosphonate 5-triphosphate diphosphatase [Geminicoccaceae bacterium 1502E]
MTSEMILTNARIVTPGEVVEGTLVVRDGQIADIGRGASGAAGAVDLGGDWLLPGLVELHTDNLERQFQPRPGVRWPADAAMLQHDAQIAGSGITTVCDAVCVGFYGGKRERLEFLKLSLEVLRRARRAGALKTEHRLHLRLEVSDPGCLELFEPLMDEEGLSVVSFMDHTPGQRQWRDIEKYRTFHMGRTVTSEDQFAAMIERRVEEQKQHFSANLARILELLEGHPAVRASHDDTTPEHVADARAMGATISEFPTTLEAARAAREAGMSIVMGGPNLVLGGSHSGNVSAAELAREGLLDVMSSDYVPASMLQAAFRLAREFGMAMPEAIAPVTRHPAELLGMADRGVIEPGRRADLVRVHEVGETPHVGAVWRAGRRIA